MHMLFILIVLLIEVPTACEGCTEGWFGKACNLSCNCRTSKSCTINGDCPAKEKCSLAKFGPACQFVDVSPFHGRPKSVLWDNDDSTCNRNVNATLVTITLENVFPLTWFRLTVKGKGYQQLDFTTTVNNGLECPDEQRFVIDRATVDVVCSGRNNLKTLKIEGTIVGSMCSLKISGGRKISLKGRIWQSSYLSSNRTQIGPQYSVDGLAPTEDFRPPCASTNLQRDRPEWRIYFNAPFYVHSLQVYNQMTYTHRLVNFDTRLYTAVANKTNKFNYSKDSGEYLFLRRLTPQVPISYISIQQAYQPVPADRIMGICEVIILGDNICPKRTYGFYCVKCQCNASQLCNQFTGACSHVCRADCLGGACDPLTGQCYRCKPGYSGDHCNKECPVGTYGVDCKPPCSKTCTNKTCHHITGHCISCVLNHVGNWCEECTDGFYGEYCDLQCPDTCLEKRCNSTTGHCIGCQPNLNGPYCEDCAFGFGGVGCKPLCPNVCVESKCDNVTGHCLSCYANWTGPYCADCADGLYGKDCNLQCPEMCFENKCDKITGDCLSCQETWFGPVCAECAVGWYGDDCKLPCPEMCFENKCDNVTGDCYSCQANWTSLDCADCADGLYGEDCNLQCPKKCFENKCDNETGDCLSCQGNWFGPVCAGCKDGYFGGICTKICSQFCKDKKCDQLSGNCLSCPGTRVGPFCGGCPDKHFGIKCENKCSKDCYDTCDSLNGSCFTCENKYSSVKCLQIAKADSSLPWWVVLSPILPLILLAAFCLQRRKHGNPADEGRQV